MSTITVQSTLDYNKFKTMFGNRNVNPLHVKRLSESLERMNLMQYQPILVSKDFEIIDGQHRLEALKILKKEVYYTIVPDSKLETIQMLNSNMKAWNLRDFCLSFAHLGNVEYITLLEFADGNDLPITTGAMLLCGSQTEGGGDFSRSIRDGLFKVKNKNNAEETMIRLKALQPFANGNVWRTRKFIAGLTTCYAKGVKHELLLSQLQTSGKRIYKQLSVRDYVLVLLDIYNRNLREGKGRIELM